jgi:hypothetical protein
LSDPWDVMVAVAVRSAQLAESKPASSRIKNAHATKLRMCKRPTTNQTYLTCRTQNEAKIVRSLGLINAEKNVEKPPRIERLATLRS